MAECKIFGKRTKEECLLCPCYVLKGKNLVCNYDEMMGGKSSMMNYLYKIEVEGNTPSAYVVAPDPTRAFEKLEAKISTFNGYKQISLKSIEVLASDDEYGNLIVV